MASATGFRPIRANGQGDTTLLLPFSGEVLTLRNAA